MWSVVRPVVRRVVRRSAAQARLRMVLLDMVMCPFLIDESVSATRSGRYFSRRHLTHLACGLWLVSALRGIVDTQAASGNPPEGGLQHPQKGDKHPPRQHRPGVSGQPQPALGRAPERQAWTRSIGWAPLHKRMAIAVGQREANAVTLDF